MVAVCGCGMSALVREGDGHEIWLEGEREEVEKEAGRGGEVVRRPGYVRESTTQGAMR